MIWYSNMIIQLWWLRFANAGEIERIRSEAILLSLDFYFCFFLLKYSSNYIGALTGPC